MADAFQQHAATFCAQFFEKRIALVAITHPHTNFDELMKFQSPFQFLEHVFAQAFFRNGDHRLGIVGEGAKVFFLAFGELHGVRTKFRWARIVARAHPVPT